LELVEIVSFCCWTLITSAGDCEQFQDVNHANRVLSDPRKKAIYDQYGSLGLYACEQFGEDNVNTYFLLTSPVFKVSQLNASFYTQYFETYILHLELYGCMYLS